MAFTYDVTTNRGKVRLKIGDTDTVNVNRQLFTDAEIDAFLAMNDSSILLSAAAALDAMAANQAMVLKVITIMDLKTDGASVARELRLEAKGMRETYSEFGEGDMAEMFDWAEYAETDFAKRERIYKQSLLE